MSQKLLSWKYVGHKNFASKFLDSKKIFVKIFLSKNLFCPINVQVKTNLFVQKKWFRKMLAPKKLDKQDFSRIFFSFKDIFVYNLLVQKKFELKENLCPKKILGPKYVGRFLGPISLPRSKRACIYHVIKFCPIIDPPSQPS